MSTKKKRDEKVNMEEVRKELQPAVEEAVKELQEKREKQEGT